VQRALASRGHEAVLWYAADLPQTQTLQWELDGAEARVEVRGSSRVDGRFDAVWNRRPRGPVMPSDMHPGDRTFAAREWSSCIAGTWRTIGAGAFWVNPVDAAERAECKPLQLVEANRVGLKTPPTLISNDPDRIRAFVDAQDGETVYKPFDMGRWSDGTTIAGTSTSVVAPDAMDDDDALRLCPGIFQPRIAKDHELRVTFVGHRAFAARLESQRHDETRVDWRVGAGLLDITPTSLPDGVEARCRALMDRLGIVFACFDFVVTPAGEHLFLELNQAGQFLWVERAEPRLLMLEAMVSMLAEGRPDYAWRPQKPLRFADFCDYALDELADADHVPTAKGEPLPDVA
jgi:glutathione synthase/RimK-type ligase-like ATP-grasp enzyme